MSQSLQYEPKHLPSLKILHCLRAPVGGLFRHVIDLAMQQAALGHDVGVVCAATGDGQTEARLLTLSQSLSLGLHRLEMTRDLGLGDFKAWRRVVALADVMGADVLHGHGAKGGAYARLAKRGLKSSRPQLRCFYTPHGGSLHYAPGTFAGQFYARLERRLEAWTDGILFESAFASTRYARHIGVPRCETRVVTNGLLASEFLAVVPNPDAADFVFVGELRMLKGVDVALDALAKVNAVRRVTAVIAGDGPDASRFREQANSLGLKDLVEFAGPMRARDAFVRGRVLLVPSRAESLPYIVLEAIAACLPVIATNVGGIPEIIPAEFGPLVPPGDHDALAAAMMAALDQPAALGAKALALQAAIRPRFNVGTMARGVTEFYAAQRGVRIAA